MRRCSARCPAPEAVSWRRRSGRSESLGRTSWLSPWEWLSSEVARLKELRSVLVVEDNEQNRELVEYLLVEAGIKVQSAADVRGALEIVRIGSIDLVLLDMQIPGSGEVDVVGQLHAAAAGRRMLVVALTAHAMRGDRERFLSAGCDEYIAKPIRTATFVDELRALFATAEARGGCD